MVQRIQLQENSARFVTFKSESPRFTKRELIFYIDVSAAVTLGARDFSNAVSGFCQVFIVTRAKSPAVFLAASAYVRICVGLRPTLKIPAAREQNLWYPRYVAVALLQKLPS